MKAHALEKIGTAFAGTTCSEILGNLVLDVPQEEMLGVLESMRTDPDLQFDILLDVTVIDYLDYPVAHANRFAVVYTLRSLPHNMVAQVRIAVNDPEAEFPVPPESGRPPTGENARPTINMAFASTAIPT